MTGVAVLASVFTRHGGYASPHAFISGFTSAIWVAAGLSTLGILTALVIPRARATRPATPHPQPHPAPATQEAPSRDIIAVLLLPSCQHRADAPGPALQQLSNHHQLLATCMLSLTTCRRAP